MLRMLGPQGSLFELFLPAGMQVLSGELAEIDAILDDPRFFVATRPLRQCCCCRLLSGDDAGFA